MSALAGQICQADRFGTLIDKETGETVLINGHLMRKRTMDPLIKQPKLITVRRPGENR
jgi:hypothetical protein